jgi:hypothetical protein
LSRATMFAWAADFPLADRLLPDSAQPIWHGN